MILYHGSNTDIVHIDLKAGIQYKDFGQGFYLTPDRNTACRMAQKKSHLFGGEATLISYEFDQAAFESSSIKVKIFPEKASEEWFLFVYNNRNRSIPHPIHDYDIVVGPIADDGVVLQFTNYDRGTSSPEQAAKDLQDKYLDQQYYFGTELALTHIQKIKSERV